MPENNTTSGKNEKTNRVAMRGFASMDPEKQKKIASKGGKAAHAKGVAHQWTTEEARAAGKKGGEIIGKNKEHMSRIGKIGGKALGSGRKKKTAPEDRHQKRSEG